MRKLHVIDNYDRMGGEVYFRHAEKYAHDPELMEAYECGYKHGRKEAYKEIMEEQYGGSYNHREHMGRTMPPMMREHEREWREPEDDEVSYRRRRMNGRFF